MPQQEQALEYLEEPEHAEAYVGTVLADGFTAVVTVTVLWDECQHRERGHDAVQMERAGYESLRCVSIFRLHHERLAVGFGRRDEGSAPPRASDRASAVVVAATIRGGREPW
jgi:hypothetical protein